MATQSTLLRQSELLNQLILDSNTLEELGRVEVLWMYPPAHRVLGLISKSGWLGQQKGALKLSQIEAVGESGLLTHARPQETTADRVRQIESLIDHEVWSQDGDRLGKIIDCLFNLQTGEITHYLFVSSGWASFIEGVYQLPPSQILSFGNQRVLVAEANVATLELYRPGISRKITQVGETLKEEAVQEFNSIAQKAEQTTEQAKEQLHQFTDRARTQAQSLSERLKGKTQGWLEVAREKGQLLVEQVREGSALITRQVEESIESLTTPDLDGPESDLADLDDIWPEDELEPPASAQPEVAASASTADDVWAVGASPTPPQPAPQPDCGASEPATTPDDLLDDWDDEPWDDDQVAADTQVLNQEVADRIAATSTTGATSTTSAVRADLDDDEPWI